MDNTSIDTIGNWTVEPEATENWIEIYLNNSTTESTIIATELLNSTEQLASEDDITSYTLFVIDMIRKYLYPVIIFVGLISNTLSIIVLSRPNVAIASVSYYLLNLAFSDSIVLALDFLKNYVTRLLGVPTIGLNTHLCRSYMFIFNVAFTYSAWLVVTVTVERLFAIWLPLKAMTITSRSKAKKIAFVLLMIISLFLCYNTWVWEASDKRCVWAEGWENFHSEINMFLMGFTYSYIPSVTLVICNILISIKLFGANTRRKKLQNSGNTDKVSQSTRKVTITILTVSVAYLILTVPLSVLYLLEITNIQGTRTDVIALANIIVLLLALCNHGVNFWLYVFTSESFRRELSSLVKCKVNTRAIHKSMGSISRRTTSFNMSEREKQPELIRITNISHTVRM